MAAPKAPRRDPRTGQSVPKVVHQLFLEHQTDDYKAGDQKLRLLGGLGVALGIGGAVFGHYVVNSDIAAVAGMLVGVLVFFAALFAASRRYKHAYRTFIEDHMADDGTFLFCPECRYDLSGQNQHRVCPECGAKPWIFTPGK
ncbi:MAG: hypothetical protein AAGI54_01925 [Planctomycetota bacterium]